MRRKKKKKRNREMAATELCNDTRPNGWIRKEPSVVREHQKRRRSEADAEENQSSWSKLFNNLILRGYLFVVTFPFGMQSNERLD